MNRKIIVFTLITAMIFAMTILLINSRRHPLDLTSALAAEIVIEPTQYDNAGVDSNSQFLVKASTYIDPKIVADNISVEPKINFSVEEQKNSNKILLIPEKPLEANKIYRFTLDLAGSDPLKWAFQTKGQFKINGSLPRDKSTGVPTNTGIEINFSHEGFHDLEKYFEISPQTAGHFEIHKKTAVFVPKSLDPGTVYTVKVKKGLKLAGSDVALAEDYVFRFETQDPAQHNGNREYFEFFTDTMEFAENISPVIPLGYFRTQTEGVPEVKVTLYRYRNGQDYIKSIEEREKVPYWAYCSKRDYLAETRDLEQVQTFTTNLISLNGENFLEFPAPLKAGYYLAEATLGSITRQLWLQVSDLAVYTAVGENKTLVWVNNLLEGKPAVNATVALSDSDKEVLTNEKGLAEIPTPPLADTGLYIIVKDGDKETVVPVKPDWLRFPAREKTEEGLAARDFWKYLYLDRELYQPNDTVQFWGLVKGRTKDIQNPKQVTIALTKWQAGQDGNVILKEKQVDVQDNVFTGEIKLPNLVPGYYYLAVKQGDLVIIQHGFEVQTYTKPAYRIDVKPEKKAVYAGDTMQFSIAATCFEETPVPQVSLRYTLDDSGELVTDEKGQAVLSYTPRYRADEFGAIVYRHLYLNANLPESGEISSGAYVIVLNNDIEIKADGKITGTSGQVNIKVDKLAVDKVNEGKADPWEEDAFVIGHKAGHPVTVSLFRQEWDKIEDGEYYDYINKVVRKKYRYQERRVLVKESTVVTDKNGQAEYSFQAEDKKSYWVRLTALDSKNNQATTEIYLSGGDYPEYPNFSWYYLDDEKKGQSKYQEGDRVLLTMKKNEGKLTDRKDSFLFYTGRLGIREFQIQDSGSFHTVFKEEDIPNFWVKGVYFDGRVYHETSDYLVDYDEREKELEIKVETDKDKYRPQDKVQVSVEVRDKKGRPVAAIVNLNLVDEALYMLSPQQVNILGSLYGDYLSNGVWMTASTHQNPANYYGGGAEQGGEGGVGRQDFRDTAFFETISTGRDGKASVSFTVPDNLTSWRLTYQAVTKDLRGVSGTKKINVGLPFFVDMVLNDNYLVGDTPVINLRSLGTGLNEDDEVSYQVLVKRDNKVYHETALKGRAFLPVSLNLPVLEEGKYQITVTGRGGGFSDVLTRSFQTVESFMTQEKIDYQILTSQTKILTDSTKPVTLTFSDVGRSRYLSTLCSLTYLEGSRIEQKLAPMLAWNLLKEHFPEWEHLPSITVENLYAYQAPDGGISILPYGSSDLELSAKIAPWAEECFDLAALKAYLTEVVNDPKETRERGIIALYGLASLGEPVLQDVVFLLQEKDLTVTESLYLILSLNQLGNEQPARKILKELLAQYGKANGPYMEINYGKDKDEQVKISSLTALAAGRLKFAEAHQLAHYVMENPPEEELTYMEQIAILQESLQDLSHEKVSFTFILEEKKKSITLAPGETYSIILTPEELKLLSFENILGEVGVSTRYTTSYTPSSQDSAEGASLTRDYRVKGQSTRKFKPGDLVEVEIRWSMGGKSPKGLYRITDYLPSGLKAVEKPYQWGVVTNNLGWPIEVDGQKVVFLVSEKGTLRYYARIINQGSFTGQNMTIQHVGNGKIYGVTPLDRVEIK
ncbi:MAG TPA: alpha-2-macroglobulin [Clostridia bacterium]|nr:alpha-2-macroglobulin [Clostridia bacterium]